MYKPCIQSNKLLIDSILPVFLNQSIPTVEDFFGFGFDEVKVLKVDFVNPIVAYVLDHCHLFVQSHSLKLLTFYHDSFYSL